MQTVNVLDHKAYKDDAVNKLTHFATEQMSVDTYYFNPGQVLKYHVHANSDQIFFFIEGEGKFYLNQNGQDEVIDVRPGVVVLAPAGVQHQVENTGSVPLVASQVTKLPL